MNIIPKDEWIISYKNFWSDPLQEPAQMTSNNDSGMSELVKCLATDAQKYTHIFFLNQIITVLQYLSAIFDTMYQRVEKLQKCCLSLRKGQKAI